MSPSSPALEEELVMTAATTQETQQLSGEQYLNDYVWVYKTPTDPRRPGTAAG
jgi:hypothetical protein